jgi:hypothetical protein
LIRSSSNTKYEVHAFFDRYSPNGRWTIEENIKWERLRVPPIDSSSHVLHISDCLDDLRPGDHVEIQWRRNKEFPYGMSHLMKIS